jgi:hypothetical protein
MIKEASAYLPNLTMINNGCMLASSINTIKKKKKRKQFWLKGIKKNNIDDFFGSELI